MMIHYRKFQWIFVYGSFFLFSGCLPSGERTIYTQLPIGKVSDGNDDENVIGIPSAEDDTTEYLFVRAEKPENVDISDEFSPFFSNNRIIRQDIIELTSVDNEAVPFIRYLTLDHLDYLNYETEDDWYSYKSAMLNSLSIIVNSLSTSSEIVLPTPIDPSWSVLRIDLRDYGWSQEQWEEIIFGQIDDPNKKPYPFHLDFDPAIADISALTKTEVPVVRADWFTHEILKQNNYHRLANIPEALFLLERSLNVDRVNNIIRSIEQPGTNLAARIGIAKGKSKVSVNNRLLERHETNFGAFWLSYDFDAAVNEGKDFFESPIGPGPEVDFSFNSLGSFVPDGGEMIWHKPNGLLGFMLVEQTGERIDSAPTSIVFDPTARENQGVVDNGRSCFKCHALGFVEVDDQVRPFFDSNQSEQASAEILRAVQSVHPESDKMNDLFKQDNAAYRAALNKAKMVPVDTSRVLQLSDLYELNKGHDQVAGMFNLTGEQLKKKVETLPQDLRSRFSDLSLYPMPQDEIEERYADIILQLFGFQQKILENRFEPEPDGNNQDNDEIIVIPI